MLCVCPDSVTTNIPVVSLVSGTTYKEPVVGSLSAWNQIVGVNRSDNLAV